MPGDFVFHEALINHGIVCSEITVRAQNTISPLQDLSSSNDWSGMQHTTMNDSIVNLSGSSSNLMQVREQTVALKMKGRLKSSR